MAYENHVIVLKNAINVFYSYNVLKNENYKAAQDVLLTAYTLPEAEKIAFELIKV
jgi:predicted secreted protein